MNAVVSLARQFVVVRSSVAWHAHVSRDPFARLHLAEGRRDPYAIYDEVRRRGELIRSPLVGYQTATHRVCRQVLRDRRFGVRSRVRLSRGDGQMSLLELDPPDHTRLRRLVAPAFTPHAIAGYRPRIEKVVDGLLDAQPGRRAVGPGRGPGLAVADRGDHRPARGARRQQRRLRPLRRHDRQRPRRTAVRRSRGPADRGRPAAQTGAGRRCSTTAAGSPATTSSASCWPRRVTSSRRRSCTRCACCCCWPGSRPPST